MTWRDKLRKMLEWRTISPFEIVDVLPEATVAAKWWSDRLQESSKRQEGYRNQLPAKPAPQQITTFESALSRLISQEIAQHGPETRIAMMMTIDCEPNDLLKDALSEAGIQDTFRIFPGWAIMIIENHTVQVMPGLGKPYQSINVE